MLVSGCRCQCQCVSQVQLFAQPGVNQVQLFDPTRIISGLVIQPNPKYIGFSYSTQLRDYQVLEFNPMQLNQVSYPIPTRRISGIIIQPNPENLRYNYSTQPGESQISSSTQPRFQAIVIQPYPEKIRLIYLTQPGENQCQCINLTWRKEGLVNHPNQDNLRFSYSTYGVSISEQNRGGNKYQPFELITNPLK